MKVVETHRLTLQPLTTTHAEEMFAVLSDSAIHECENPVAPAVRHNEIANGAGGM